MLNKEFVKETILNLRDDYVKVRLKAFNEDNVELVHQFTGSMVALEVLLSQLGLDEEEGSE